MQFNGKVTIKNGVVGSGRPVVGSGGPVVGSDSVPKGFIFNGPVVLIDTEVRDTSNMVFNGGVTQK